MKRTTVILSLILACSMVATGQKDLKYIREGNKAFKKEAFDESEIAYRKALESRGESYRAGFNLGDALYKQEKYSEAVNQFEQLLSPESNTMERSRVMHNIGNSQLNGNELQQSIESYKEALRNNPDDMETKYNLSYALQMKNQQQQQQQQQPGDGEQEKQNQQEQEENSDQEEQEEQQNQQDPNKEEKQERRQPSDQITKEDAERLLQALANDEKKVMEKVQKQKASAKKIATEKEW